MLVKGREAYKIAYPQILPIICMDDTHLGQGVKWGQTQNIKIPSPSL